MEGDLHMRLKNPKVWVFTPDYFATFPITLSLHRNISQLDVGD